MEQRRLGRSGLSVSRLGLSTGTWGGLTDAGEAADLLAVFAEAGGTLLDTAPTHGGGTAEELLGALLNKSLRRSDFVLATKAGLRLRDGVPDCSRRALLDELDWSLVRLDTDHVDLWQVHVYDPQTDLSETLSALDYAVATGRARYVAVANHCGWQFATTATRQLASTSGARIVANQVEYSLLNRSAEIEIVPAAAALDAGVLAGSPLGGGVLTGKYRANVPLDSRAARSTTVDAYLTGAGRLVVDALSTAAEGLGVAPAAVALAWLRDRPGVRSAMLGARTAEQLKICLTAESLVLPAEIRGALDDVSSATRC
ncbi:MAG: aldo/keto reductase [Sporichthyaceae bacterium]